MITDKIVCIIQSGKAKSDRLAQLTIGGVGGRGRIHYGDGSSHITLADDETPVIIGTHLTTYKHLHAFREAQRPFVVIDNGYMKGYLEGGYFRATTNAMQWVGGEGGRRPVEEMRGSLRFHSLDMAAMKPWKNISADGHVLVVLQSPVWYTMMGLSRDAWVDELLSRLKTATTRPIIVRDKPLKGAPPQPPLEQHFENCVAVVGFSSAAMIKAVLAGIPVFPQAPCAVSPLGTSSLDDIGVDKCLLRLPTLFDLAANQWNESEIQSGRMWSDLTHRYEHSFPELA